MGFGAHSSATLSDKPTSMSALLDSVDPDGLLEYSVVYTDRSLNHMSAQFQQVMNDIHRTLTSVYRAHRAVVVPGGGTFGMEAVARQFCEDEVCLVLRNGWFSYRWSQIFDAAQLPREHLVMKASLCSDAPQSGFEPPAIEDVIARIEREKPAVVCAPHVETSAGLMLPDEYLHRVADAVHGVGGIFVLDCVASGTAWVDMQATGVDVLVSAPQKGWSGSPCAGLVMLSERAHDLMSSKQSSSFAVDLGKWNDIMQAYLDGAHAYHATMPTDALVTFRDVMHELADHGFDVLKQRQAQLGTGIRSVLEDAGFNSVAAAGYHASGVAVYYTDDDAIATGRAFAQAGMQIAAGVPLMVDEPDDFKSFRVGLFGVDKLQDVNGAVARFADTLERVRQSL